MNPIDEITLAEALEILKLDEKASFEEIRNAYHKLALTSHPDRKQDEDDAVFLIVKNAYDKVMDVKQISIESRENKTPVQLPPNEFNLKLTLDEILTGCVKKEKIVCQNVDENGVVTSEEKEVSITVKSGSLPETRIIIEKIGNKEHGKVQANVVFIVEEKPHSVFKRHRFDLLYTATVNVEDVYSGGQIEIPTLENEMVLLEFDEDVIKKDVHKIPSRGLPYPDSSNERGDLIVTFKIIYDNV